MRANGLHSVWNEGKYALNAWLSIGSSYSAEVLAHLPYDAVTVDLQHGMFDFCPDVAFAREMVSLGCDLLTVMNDAGLLRKATSALIEE